MKHSAAGFTLLEMIALMVFISVALVGISGIFANNNFALRQSQDYQNAVQYAQECAERVLSVKRNIGFNATCLAVSTDSPICNQTCATSTVASAIWGTSGDTTRALPDDFHRTVIVPASYTGTSTTACPNGAICRDVTVTVTKGSATSSLTVLLVNY